MPETPAAAPVSASTPLVFAPTHPRVRKAIDAVALGSMAWKTIQAARSKWKTRTQYRVSVEETDDLYPSVHAWLVARVPAERRRSLVARTSRRDSLVAYSAAPGAPVPEVRRTPLSLFYDGQIALSVSIEGHSVSISIEERTGIDSGDSSKSWKRPDRVNIDCSGYEAREAVIRWLEGLVPAETERSPRLYVALAWGTWSYCGDLPPRTLDTVVVADGMAERLVDDLERFYGAESDYALLGVPWHRGYLFHGPPGTGKTSLARALATQFRLDVYWLPISSIESDDYLVRLMTEVPARSLLLLEDIDVVHAASDRDDAAAKGVTAAGLLNALDGIVTPHGLVTIMTTNRLDVLDDALVRPGRADVKAEIGYLDTATARRLAARITGKGPDDFRFEVSRPDLSAAEITSAALPYLGDYDRMAAAIEAAVSG